MRGQKNFILDSVGLGVIKARHDDQDGLSKPLLEADDKDTDRHDARVEEYKPPQHTPSGIKPAASTITLDAATALKIKEEQQRHAVAYAKALAALQAAILASHRSYFLGSSKNGVKQDFDNILNLTDAFLVAVRKRQKHLLDCKPIQSIKDELGRMGYTEFSPERITDLISRLGLLVSSIEECQAQFAKEQQSLNADQTAEGIGASVRQFIFGR